MSHIDENILIPATKSPRSVKVLNTLRVICGICLVYAAFMKVHDPSNFLMVMKYDGAGPATQRLAFLGIVAIESFLGYFIIFGWGLPFSAGLGVALLTAYTVQLLLLCAYPDSPRCGCFGVAMEMERTRIDHLVGSIRNALMIAVLVCVWRHQRGRDSATTPQADPIK